MKKNLLKCTAILLASVMMLPSCSNEEKGISTPEANTDVQTLINDLDALNQVTLAQYGNAIDFTTRGIDPEQTYKFDTPEFEAARMKWWQRLLCVVVADALGATCGTAAGGPAGGAVVGIAASLEMFKETGCMAAINNSSTNLDTDFEAFTIVMDSINYNMNNNISNFDNIGDCHNIILREILNNKNLYLNEDGSLKENLVIEKIKSLVQTFGYDASSISTSSIATELNKLSTSGIITKNATLESQMSNYVTLYPERNNEAEIIKNYVTTAASLPNVEAIKNYSIAFENTVYCAQISNNIKGSILAGQAVAKNSVVGWNIVSKQSPEIIYRH